MEGIFLILTQWLSKKAREDGSCWLRAISNKAPFEYIIKGTLTQTVLINLYKVNAHENYALICLRES